MGITNTHEELPASLSQTILILANFNFGMASNKLLDGYLFCKMPVGVLEVEVKVKTTWGKFNMVQDIHTTTEKYHMWEKADGRSNIKTGKRKAPGKMTTMQIEDNTSKTDVPTGQGFRYPPQVFTDPTYAGNNTPNGRGRRSRTRK